MNPVQPIQNAKDRLLNQGGGNVPDVRGGILNYFRPLNFSIVKKKTVNLVLVEETELIQAAGHLQPGKQKLDMKPEGQRRWKPWTLWTLPVVVLEPDSIVTIVDLKKGNTSYRVMGKKDWSEAGYVEYDLEQDYKNPPGGS